MNNLAISTQIERHLSFGSDLVRHLAEREEKIRRLLLLLRLEISTIRDLDLENFTLRGVSDTIDPNSAAEIARLNWVIGQIDEVLEDE